MHLNLQRVTEWLCHAESCAVTIGSQRKFRYEQVSIVIDEYLAEESAHLLIHATFTKIDTSRHLQTKLFEIVFQWTPGILLN